MRMKLNKSVVKMAARTAKQIAEKNAPKIFAGIGIGLGAGTVAMTVRGTVKAVEIVKDLKKEKGEPLTKKEVVKGVWKQYVPAASLGLAATACVIGSVHISARRLAVMTAAYSMSEDSLEKYKAKARELLGEKKEEELRGEINQDYVNANPPSQETGIVKQTGGGKTLCLDKYTGQYFWSDADTIQRVINQVNNLLLHDYQVSLNELYMELGIEQAKFGDEYGWNIRNTADLIEPDFTTVLGDNNEPVLVLDYIVPPYPNYRHYM